METVIKGHMVYAMSPDNEPAFRVPSGSTLVFDTFDCFGGQITCEEKGMDTLDWDHTNPATGPVYIEGAEPGDALRVAIHTIELDDHGTMCAIPENGIFGDRIEKSSVRILPVHDDMVEFTPDIQIPCNKMIGVIGVAPAEGSINCGTPGSHGGNMDNTQITENTVIYLPVRTPGALLAMGDVHAAMGDGEVNVSGVEIAARITVTVDVIKNMPIENPLLENDEKIYAIASNTNLFEAIHTAASTVLELTMERLGMNVNDAGMLLSACGNAEVCQIVDPLMTARFSMPKKYVGGWEK